MPTVIGLIFLALGIYCLVNKEDWLLGFLIFSGLFQASSVINFGSFGIQPFYFASCLFLYSQAKKKRFWKHDVDFSGKRVLAVFGGLGLFSALAYPFIFAGIPVYSPKIGIDDGFLYHPPLQFSVGNLAQAAYLVVELVTVWFAASAIKNDKTRTFYDYCFKFLVGLIFLQFACLQLGISFPYAMLQNNPGYSMAEVGLDPAARVIGTFSEPSGVGLVLAIFYAGYFFEFFSGAGSAFKVIVAAISIGLVRSSSALATMLLTTVLILISYPVYRFPWSIRGSRLWKLSLVLAVAVLIAFSPLNATLREYTTEKNESVSYIHRTAADLFSLQLAANTHWIGVGLGSNRPSSLLTSLLSNVGMLGLILFLVLVVQIARNPKGMDVWIRWALFAAIFDSMLGGPDITQPWIWIVLTLATHYGTAYQEGAVPRGS